MQRKIEDRSEGVFAFLRNLHSRRRQTVFCGSYCLIKLKKSKYLTLRCWKKLLTASSTSLNTSNKVFSCVINRSSELRLFGLTNLSAPPRLLSEAALPTIAPRPIESM